MYQANQNRDLHAGMLPEFDALASVLELDPDWGRDALGLRAVQLAALAGIAETYVAAGVHISISCAPCASSTRTS